MWEKINNQEQLEKFQKSLEKDIERYDLADAKALYDFLKKIFDKEGIDDSFGILAKKYKKLMFKAGGICFSLLNKKQAQEVLQKGMDEILLLQGIDFIEELKKFFIFNYSIIIDRVATKDEWVEMLIKNDNKFISLTVNNKKLNTIGDWLQNYLASINQEEPDLIKINHYLNNSNIVSKLKNEDLARLKKLLYIFEYLRLARFKPMLLDDELSATDESGDYIVTGDRVEKVDAETKKLVGDIANILNISRAPSQVKEAYTKDKTKLITKNKIIENYGSLKKAGLNLIERMKKNSINKGDKNEVISILEYLSQNGELLKIIRGPKISSELKKIFQQSKILNEQEKQINIPESIGFFQNFLKYMLEEKLFLNENDAAREGQKIANILKNSIKVDYLKISYFDLDKEEFMWS